MLDKLRQEEQEEKKKIQDRKLKVVKEKLHRDMLLMDYETKKHNDFK